MQADQDSKHYLAELINLYTDQLDKPIASTFGELIQEKRKECIHKLDQLKQVDMEATLWAKSRSTKELLSRSVFPFTN